MTVICTTCLIENDPNTMYCIACGSALENANESSNTEVSQTTSFYLNEGVILKQGAYRITCLLGAGGFGITYKGENITDQQPVAIKELWPEKAARIGNQINWPPSISPQVRLKYLRAFKAEAETLAQCKHTNIVEFLDWFEENNTAYIVMQLVQGKPLDKILDEQGKLTENSAKKYFIQAAYGLQTIHAKNILHRDIKPGNLIIDYQDNLVLIDFGNAKEFIGGLTQEMSVTLTQGYAPLEQYSYRGRRSPATDIYALCASMYELLTGQLPPDAVSRMQNDTIIPPRQLNSQISSQMERVLLQGLRVKVEERFQTVEELIDALNGKFTIPGLNQARQLAQQGHLEAAVQAYDRCLRNEYDPEIVVEKALVLLHLNDPEVETAVDEAVKVCPQDGRTQGAKGLLLCRQGMWAEAIQCLNKAVQLSPHSSWIQANYAWALAKTQQLKAAETAIDKALIVNPNCVFAKALKGWILLQLNEPKKAISAARSAITLSNQEASLNTTHLYQWLYPTLIIALGQAVSKLPSIDIERCLQEFESKISDSTYTPALRGWYLARQARWNEAESCFKQIEEISELPQWLTFNIGITYENLNYIELAIGIYENIVNSDVCTPNLYFRLGTLYGIKKDYSNAKKYLEKAIDLQPDFAPAYHNLAWTILELYRSQPKTQLCHQIISAYQKAGQFYKNSNKYYSKSIEKLLSEIHSN